MGSKITIKVTIPADRFGCSRCNAENIARIKKLFEDHIRQEIKELLEVVKDGVDKKGLG